jgi:CRISPR/Cas system CSM-associated protein Csm3 (group 7 of RAMP superfamily)
VVIGFKLRLKAATLLTVGWGVPDVMGADVVHSRKLQFDGSKAKYDYVYYISGSSVKGSLRTAASKVAAAYGFSSCGEVKPERIEAAHKGSACDVCRLFGYPSRDPSAASSVFVSDFNPVGGVNSTILFHVALDDRTLTALEGALYSMEHLLPGAEFEGEVRVSEASRGLLPLLLLAIAELRTGRLGRASICDVKVVDGGALDAYVERRWHPLLQELRGWLWEGMVA